MRALVLIVVLACSSEKQPAVDRETPAQLEERCGRARNLAITLVRERRSFASSLRIGVERLEQIVRRQLDERPGDELKAIHERAKTLVDEATSTREAHQACVKAFEAGDAETARTCAEADGALAGVWKSFQALVDQLAKTKLAPTDQLVEAAADKARNIDNTLAKILAPLAECPRKP